MSTPLSLIVLLSIFTFALCIPHTDFSNAPWQEWKFAATAHLVHYNDYADQLAKKVVSHLEKDHISSDHFKVYDYEFEIDVNMTSEQVAAQGNAILSEGFVNSIKSITRRLLMTQDMKANHIKFDLIFRDVSIMYNIEYKFENEPEGYGGVLVDVPQIIFTMTVSFFF